MRSKSCLARTCRCDSAGVGQKRVSDERLAQAGGSPDLSGAFERPEEESAALQQGEERTGRRWEAQEETGFSGRAGDQNQDRDWVFKTETGTDAEEVSDVKVTLVKSLYIFFCLLFMLSTASAIIWMLQICFYKNKFKTVTLFFHTKVFLLYCNKSISYTTESVYKYLSTLQINNTEGLSQGIYCKGFWLVQNSGKVIMCNWRDNFHVVHGQWCLPAGGVL